MAPRIIDVDNLPDPLPPLVLLVGDEELLVGRAIGELAAAARRVDPQSAATELSGGQLAGPELHELLGPSLFGDARLIVLRGAQDVSQPRWPQLRPYLDAPGDGVTLVVQHAGGAKGKPCSSGSRRRLPPRSAAPGSPAPTSGPTSSAPRSGAPAAARIPTQWPRSSTRWAATCVSSPRRRGQLVSDSGGEVDVDQVVRAYHRGRAEVTGFAVADHAVVGNRVAALETLRHALVIGVPQVVIADALADGVRTVARVAAATGGRGS